MIPLIATAALEKALNQCLRLDPESLARITRLEGRVIAVEVAGLGQTLYLVPTATGLRLQRVFEGEPDVTLRGAPLSLARLGLSDHPTEVFGQGVEMRGDAQLGRKLQRILEGLRIDWEEALSHLSGDVVAHQLGNALRGLLAWGRNSSETLGRDVAEYFQEESRDLVTRAELDPFLDGVDKLRSDLDRLGQRVQRLQARLGSKGSARR